MLRLKIYSVYDSKAEAYNTPIFMRTHGEAIRSFESAVLDEKTDFHRHAEDYSLFHVGEFDTLTGNIESNVTPIPLSRAHEVLARQVSAA